MCSVVCARDGQRKMRWNPDWSCPQAHMQGYSSQLQPQKIEALSLALWNLTNCCWKQEILYFENSFNVCVCVCVTLKMSVCHCVAGVPQGRHAHVSQHCLGF